MAKMTAPREFHSLQMFQSFKAKTHHEDREGHEDLFPPRRQGRKVGNPFFLAAFAPLRESLRFACALLV
jgi:hypothetical protein